MADFGSTAFGVDPNSGGLTYSAPADTSFASAPPDPMQYYDPTGMFVGIDPGAVTASGSTTPNTGMFDQVPYAPGGAPGMSDPYNMDPATLNMLASVFGNTLGNSVQAAAGGGGGSAGGSSLGSAAKGALSSLADWMKGSGSSILGNIANGLTSNPLGTVGTLASLWNNIQQINANADQGNRLQSANSGLHTSGPGLNAINYSTGPQRSPLSSMVDANSLVGVPSVSALPARNVSSVPQAMQPGAVSPMNLGATPGLRTTSGLPPGFAHGGAAMGPLSADVGRTPPGHVQGPGDGQSDSIPARLGDGEYVLDSDSVSALGNGSTKAGAAVLDRMRENLRAHKRSAPPDKIPPKAKTPEQYMKGGLRRGQR